MTTGRQDDSLEGDGGYRDVHETEIGDRRPSDAVVDAVAALVDVEPADLSPLYGVVDPDALDGLATSGDVAHLPEVTFEYEGFSITVEGTQRVRILEA